MGVMRRSTEATATFNTQHFGISADPGMIVTKFKFGLI
jgi:hypothetical protein